MTPMEWNSSFRCEVRQEREGIQPANSKAISPQMNADGTGAKS
jgi:hypothetical protein